MKLPYSATLTRLFSRTSRQEMPDGLTPVEKGLVVVLCMLFLLPADLFAAAGLPEAQEADPLQQLPDKELLAVAPPQNPAGEPEETEVYLEPELIVPTDSTEHIEGDTLLNVVVDDKNPYGLDGKIPFNPAPERAVWLSALLPGLGQIYNRRYWKLPIIVGGFMGLGYATAWNNNQYADYTQGYRDLLDADPTSNSYMNFFPPNTNESDLDREWLTRLMKNRKDYYRRNRDLCIICVVALYLLCMVDAYVDASLAHFDISPDLSMDVQPAMFVSPADRRWSLGLNWAFNF